MFHSQCPEQGEGSKRGRDREVRRETRKEERAEMQGADRGNERVVKEDDRDEAWEGGRKGRG